MVELVIEITAFQDLRRVFTFIDDSIHCRLEGELEVLRQVVLDIYIAVPGKVLTICQIHRSLCRPGDVTHLHVTEGTVHVRVKGPRLRQVVEIHLFEELHFGHFLHFRKRFPWFGVEIIRILERTLMIGRHVFLQFRRMLVLLVVRSRDREISRVHKQIPFLGVVLVDLEVRQ